MSKDFVTLKWTGILGAVLALSCTSGDDSSLPATSVGTIAQAAVASQSPTLVVNQLGYPPGATKVAILVTSDTSGSSAPENSVEVLQGGAVRWTGDASKISYKPADDNSGDAVYHADFSEFSTLGTGYTVRVTIDGSATTSTSFRIADDPYVTSEGALSKATMKFLYWKRSGFDTNFSGRAVPEFNSGSHGIGHAVDVDLPAFGGWTSARFNVLGGWYDAGDFGKYMESHAAAAFFIGNTYERTRGMQGPDGVTIEDFVLDIDESDNELPDWLDELAWGTMWVRGATPNIGQHISSPTRLHLTASKCTSQSWADWVNVDQDTAPRFCMGPGTAPAYSAVRNMAMTARLLRAEDPAGTKLTNVDGMTTGQYSSQLWSYSKELFGRLTGKHADYADYTGAESPNRDIPNTDLDVPGESPGFNQGSGAYADLDMDDDKVSAAAEMYLTACRMGESSAGIDKYKSVLTSHPDYKKAGPCDWGTEIDLGDAMEEEVGCATLSLLAAHQTCSGPNALPAADVEEMRDNLFAYADQIIANADSQSYPFFIADGGTVFWGSNGGVAAHSAILTAAYEESVKRGAPARSYLMYATKLMDYLLGVNPMRVSFLLGFGAYAEQHVHDRAMDATGKWFHGTLAGGPHNLGNEQFTALAARLGGSGNGGIDDGVTPSFGPALKRYDLNDTGRQTWECREDAINWASAMAAAAWSLRIHSADMACSSNADCDDGNACTTDVCSASVCSYLATDCSDGRTCTVDSCDPATGQCSNDAAACCATEEECSDGTACTTDACGTDELCSNADRGVCCLGTGPLTPIVATASSIESTGLEADKAVDDNPSTRWSSSFADEQWLVVDLGSTNRVSRVVLQWEAAASASYDIDVATNAAGPWTTIYSTTNGDGGTDDITEELGLTPAAGRYVRMYGHTRTTLYGHSLYEFDVYGDPDADCYQTTITCGDSSCDTGEDCTTCAADCCSSGPAMCGDGACTGSETCASCAVDCGACPSCGDGACDPGETCDNCEHDCGQCPVICGDGTCDATEDCDSCEQDCGACPVVCGDGTCDESEDCANCEQDCGTCPVCGDGTCDETEDCANCELDCGTCPVVCGDGTCHESEDCDGEPELYCAVDCGQCVPTDLAYLETECPTTVTGGYATLQTTNAGYSGDGHITNLGNTVAASYDGSSTDHATYTFTVDAGTYAMYFRIDSDGDFNNDSFYHRLDGGSWITQNNHYNSGSGWFWIQSGGGVVALDGSHTIEIANREDGLGIDKIAVLPASAPAPSGVGGEAFNCAPCEPTSCATDGAQCGSIGDGCGATIDCGSCPAGEQCDGANQCVCVPTTCAILGAVCGSIGDGCGSTLDCGTCPTGEACNAANQCETICIPDTCYDLGVECGAIGDNCGGTLDCGGCAVGEACVGNICQCQPTTCAAALAECGTLDDGCGGTLDCGSCDDGNTCTDDSCAGNTCSFVENGSCECQADADCDDANPCTADTCTANQCSNEDDGSCECQVDADCDDAEPCTNDFCNAYLCDNIDNGSCATCSDGIQNQGEEGIDCGGPCPDPCDDKCSGGPGDPFEELDGQVVMQAESFHRRVNLGSDNWTINGSAMQLTPDNGSTYTSNVVASSPGMEFDVDFTTTGSYTMYVRAAPTASSGWASDSIWIAIDGNLNTTYVDFTDDNPNFHWSSGTISVGSAGVHTIQVFGREDGIRVDKIVVTRGSAPTGIGPAESAHVRECGQCTPSTCAEQGAECGGLDDGCGSTLDCGTCNTGETCNAMNQCVATTSNCTCPSGCSNVVNAAAPTSIDGVGETCYFFNDSIGGYLNSWNTAEVDVNGTDATNTYLGSWAYPAQIDGGYYVYYRSSVGWGHLGVGQ